MYFEQDRGLGPLGAMDLAPQVQLYQTFIQALISLHGIQTEIGNWQHFES